MVINLLYRNIRGVNNRVFRKNVRDLVTHKKINLLCLQETKCNLWNEEIKNSIWDISAHGWITQNSEGMSGGLAISWDKSMFKCTSYATNKN